MKKHFSKRLLSLFLAVMMLATCAPLVPFTADAATTWTQVASSDFKQVTANVSGWADESKENDIGTVPTLQAGDKALSWSGGKWRSTVTADSNGIYNGDGYLYLNAGNDLGLSTGKPFKIDFEFATDFLITENNDKYGFLTLGSEEGNYAKSWDSGELLFGQNANGSAYAKGTQVGKDTSDSHYIATNNANISGGTTYHYVLSYTGSRISAYIADANQNIVQYIFNSTYNYAADYAIKSVRLGDDDSSYYYNKLTYKSITFYTGVNETVEQEIADDGLADRYVFAYFTGEDEGQQIKLAVSSDGHTFANLNGGETYLRNDSSGVYPTGNSIDGSKPATGGARDPFIIKKVGEDGYWIVATDLYVSWIGGHQYYNSWNNSKMLVWDVEDLSNAQNVQPWTVETTRMYKSGTGIGKAWAPEVVYDYGCPDYTNSNWVSDADYGMYMLYWTSDAPGKDMIVRAYTNDFKVFYDGAGNVIDGTNYEPDIFFSPSDQNVIDADIVYDYEEAMYYMVYKNADNATIWVTKAKTVDALINNNVSAAQTGAYYVNINSLHHFEGCELYQLPDGRWALLTDCYEKYISANNYEYSSNFYLLIFDSLDTLYSDAQSGKQLEYKRDYTTNILNLAPRHGAVAKVTEETYEDLVLNSFTISDSFPYTGTAKGGKADFGAGNDTADMAYNNILYLDTAGTSSDKAYSQDGTAKTGLWFKYAAATMLYDGVNTPASGSMFQITRYRNRITDSYSTRYLYAATLSSTNGFLTGVDRYTYNPGTEEWCGQATNWDFEWAIQWPNGRLAYTDTPNSVDSDILYSNSDSLKAYAHLYGYNGGDFPDGVYLREDSLKLTIHSGSAQKFNALDVNVTIGGSNIDVRILNYKPIREAATDIKNKLAEVKANIDKYGIDFYCKESLDSYMAAVSRVTYNINNYFTESNDYQSAVNFLREVNENGLLELAKTGPSESRIRYGNLFHFDAFVSSGSLSYLDDTYGSSSYKQRLFQNRSADGLPISFDNLNGTITVQGKRTWNAGLNRYEADSYTSMNFAADTYKIPVEPGETYIFEYTTADDDKYENQFADAMVFVPSADGTSYDGGYVDWRPRGAGTQKAVVTIPNNLQSGQYYVFFRFGVSNFSTDDDNVHTVKFSKIKFYKAEYEYWASTDNTKIDGKKTPENKVTGESLVGKGDSAIWFTTYSQPLAIPTSVDYAHFCYWCSDEELTNKVETPADAAVNGCAVLYPMYGLTELASDPDYPATCTEAGKKHEQCENCGEFKLVSRGGAETEDETRPATGHSYLLLNGKVGNGENSTFVCQNDGEHTVLGPTEAYKIVDMLKDTIDPERYANSQDLQDAKDAFDAIKTTPIISFNGNNYNGVNKEVYDAIDAAIFALLEAAHRNISVSDKEFEYNEYDVKFNVYVNGELQDEEGNGYTEIHHEYYDAITTLDATPYVDGGTVQAWTVETNDDNDSTKAIAQGKPTNTYKARVTVNTTVNAYYVTPDKTNVVTICDQYGVPMYVFAADKINVGYKADGTPDNNYISAGVDEYYVPDMPYMVVDGFSVDGTDYSYAVQDVEVNGSVTIVPLWSAPEDYYHIYLDGEQFGMDTYYEGNYKYDDRVHITADEAVYGIAIKVADGDYRIATYDNEYIFYANRDMEFFTVTYADGVYTIDGKPVTDDLTIFKLDNRLPFVYSGAKITDETTSRYTSFNAYTVFTNSELNTSNVQVLEVGTLYSIGIKTADEMTIDAEGVYKSISRTQVAPGNQYSLSVKNVSATNQLTTRAYVKYVYTGPISSEPVIAIEYGNVCSTEPLV